MLLAIAATVHLVKLPDRLISTAAWLIIFFAWTSTVAMTITAITGERGFGWFGPAANKLTYALYALGTLLTEYGSDAHSTMHRTRSPSVSRTTSPL